MTEEGEPFKGELFPCSYFVLYCPYDMCPLEEPFKDPYKLVEHLENEHKILILNVNAVLPYLDRYLKAVKAAGKFTAEQATIGDEEDTQDHTIRDDLQQQKLQEMLDLQEKERNGLYLKPRQCLFCLEYSPSYRLLFKHMFSEHNFNIGLLDNLVMVGDFLNTLDSILMKCVCIFCHNQFRSPGCLRKHMKNKRHYRIDPKNHFYDKYYIVNYVKCGALGNEAEVGENAEGEATGQVEKDDEENDWDDLTVEVDLRTTCLFCEEVFPAPNTLLVEHTKDVHGFDLEATRREFSQDRFYDYIKLITYIRHQMKDLACPVCEASFECQVTLEEHLQTEGHCKIPERRLWDQPQYLFPVFDDDPLLFDFGEDDLLLEE